MAFGQPSGPPATPRQLRELLALLEQAGHRDFRDARGPLGFTQRQANGKFTRDEAQAFIDRLEDEAHRREQDADMAPPDESRVRELPSDLLAAELQRRGWIVVEP
jgi:hypothetical protein